MMRCYVGVDDLAVMTLDDWMYMDKIDRDEPLYTPAY